MATSMRNGNRSRSEEGSTGRISRWRFPSLGPLPIAIAFVGWNGVDSIEEGDRGLPIAMSLHAGRGVRVDSSAGPRRRAELHRRARRPRRFLRRPLPPLIRLEGRVKFEMESIACASFDAGPPGVSEYDTRDALVLRPEADGSARSPPSFLSALRGRDAAGGRRRPSRRK